MTNICRDASMMYVRKVLQELRERGTRGEELQQHMKELSERVKQVPITQVGVESACEA